MELSLVIIATFIAAGCSAEPAARQVLGGAYGPYNYYDDENILPFYITLPKVANPPASLDWRTTGKVYVVPYSQDVPQPCHSCWTFASSGVLESQYAIVNNLSFDNGTGVPLSKQQIVDCAYKVGLPYGFHNGCSAGQSINSFKYIATVSGGLFKDYPNGYPYQYAAAQMVNCTDNSTDLTKFVPLNLQTYGFINPYQQFDSVSSDQVDGIEEAMVNALQFGPIAVRALYYQMNYTVDRFFTCNTTYAMNAALNCTADHAMLVVGYTPDYWIVRNSYGSGWAASPVGCTQNCAWEGGFIKIARGGNYCSILCRPSAAILVGNPYWPKS